MLKVIQQMTLGELLCFIELLPLPCLSMLCQLMKCMPKLGSQGMLKGIQQMTIGELLCVIELLTLPCLSMLCQLINCVPMFGS